LTSSTRSCSVISIVIHPSVSGDGPDLEVVAGEEGVRCAAACTSAGAWLGSGPAGSCRAPAAPAAQGGDDQVLNVARSGRQFRRPGGEVASAMVARRLAQIGPFLDTEERGREALNACNREVHAAAARTAPRTSPAHHETLLAR
jgi:hypothetical protein